MVYKILLLLSFALCLLSCSQPKYNITLDKLSKLKTGMTYSQTVDIIGLPLTIDVMKGTNHSIKDCKKSICNNFVPASHDNLKFKIDSIYADTSYCCDAYRRKPVQNYSAFNYQKDHKYNIIYLLTRHPKFWVYFDKKGRLYSYGLMLTKNIIMDSNSESIYENAVIVCNENNQPKYTPKEINYWLSQL